MGDDQTEETPKSSRQKGDVFRDDDDPLQQLDEIEETQRKIRQRKRKGLIDSIDKSRQRARNKLKEIRNSDDLDSMRLTRSDMDVDTLDADSRFNNAVVLIDTGDYEAALSTLERLCTQLPTSAAIFAKLGEVYWELAKLPEAEASLRKATELAPSSEAASLALFHVLWDQDKQAEAFAEARRFLSTADSDAYRTLIADMRTELREQQG